MKIEEMTKEDLVREVQDLKRQVSQLKATQTETASEGEPNSLENAQLLSIFDSIDQIIYVSDPETHEVLFMNKFGKEAFGKDPIGGLCYQEFQGLDDPCPFCTNDIIFKMKGKPYQWEFHNEIIDRDYLITDRVIRWPDGRDVRMELTFDVTELKRTKEALQNAYDELEVRVDLRTAELREANEQLRQEIEKREKTAEALIESEARLELALKGADLATWDYYPSTGDVVFNERWAEMLGYSLAEVEPHVKTWEKMMHPEDKPHVTTILTEHMEGRTPIYEAEHRLRHKSGEWRWILTKGKVVERDKEGNPLRMAGTHLDISDRKRAEERISEALEFNETILSASPLGITTYASNGQCLSANQAICSIVGASKDQILSQNIYEIQSWKTSGLLKDAEEVLATGVIKVREPHIMTTFGKDMWLECLFARFYVHGEPHLLLFTSDVNERKKAEESISEYVRELERVNNELDQFSYVASHDLQEPLRKLNSFSDLLRKDMGDNLPEMAARDLDFIADAANRMKILVQDLLSLSRVGRSAVKSEWISLSECADLAIDALMPQIMDARVQISRDTLPEIVGDRTLLTQLYQNLIGNAIKYRGEQAPEIRLTAEMTSRGWVFGVKDNGIGIQPQYLEQVFLPFKRLHTRQAFEGTGIGLSICRKAVSLFGGLIWAESDGEGKGAHFKFTLKDQEEAK